jgi:hypothetical protein
MTYMVFVQHGQAPTRRHETYEEATQEAQRLAQNHLNRVVTVLEVKSEWRGETWVRKL